MNRYPIITIRNVLISSIFGAGAGFAPWDFLAALMQGQGTEGVGIAAGVSALVVGTLLPLKNFHQRMKPFSYGKVTTMVFALLMAVWLPIALYMWFTFLEFPREVLAQLLVMLARTLMIILPPTIGAAVVMIGMNGFSFEEKTSATEA